MPLRKIRIKDLMKELDGSVDLFVCCGSFESRSLSAALALVPEQVKSAVIAEHVDFHRDVNRNVSILMEHFSQCSEIVELDTRSPIRSADRLASSLTKARGASPRRILFDITTFTHETLIVAIEVLSLTFGGFEPVQFLYTIAEEYDPGRDDDAKWLSKGIAEIRSVLGFPGAILPGQGAHLILLHGFEEERAKSLIARYEPDLLSLGTPLAESSTAARHHGRNRRVHEEIKRYSEVSVAEVVEFSFSASNPLECRDAILQQVTLRPDLNVVVAPMNTKISTIGVMLAGRANRVIQICYAQANTYNVKNYSMASGNAYLFTLDEGK